jgi:CheY-like chemotaxis protein
MTESVPAKLQRILYIEDDRNIRTVVKMALEAVGGFTLEVCSSGQEALDKAQAFAPQLILLDVMMPNMDGPTTLKNLHAMPGLEDTPAVFMTAKVQPSEVARYRELGAADVIAKPFNTMKLASKIEEIWAVCHG